MKLNLNCHECGKPIELSVGNLYPGNSYKCGCREMTEASVIKLLVAELAKHKEALRPFEEIGATINPTFDDTPISKLRFSILKHLYIPTFGDLRRAAEVVGGRA